MYFWLISVLILGITILDYFVHKKRTRFIAHCAYRSIFFWLIPVLVLRIIVIYYFSKEKSSFLCTIGRLAHVLLVNFGTHFGNHNTWLFCPQEKDKVHSPLCLSLVILLVNFGTLLGITITDYFVYKKKSSFLCTIVR